MNIKNIREEFRIFEKEKNLIYFDSAATSLTPNVVVDEISNYYNYDRSTVNRGGYKLIDINNKKYNDCRMKISKMLNAKFEEIIFVKSTTSGLNFIAKNIIDNLNPGDEILMSELEHHSNLLSFRELAKKKGVVIKFIELDNLTITLDNVQKAINKKTKVISLHHVSNVIGDTIDLTAIGEICKKNDIIFVVDGAQGILHETVDVVKSNVDFYVFSAHKIFGPTGLGVVFGKEKYLSNYIFEYGGDMISTMDEDSITYKPLPYRLEAGTPSIAEILALSKSIDFINELDVEKIYNHSLTIRNYCLQQLNLISDIEVYNGDIETTIISFNIKNVPVHDAMSSYAKHNVSLRGGQMCNIFSLKKINQDAILRVSFNIYNNEQEVDEFIRITKFIIEDPMLWMEI